MRQRIYRRGVRWNEANFAHLARASVALLHTLASWALLVHPPSRGTQGNPTSDSGSAVNAPTTDGNDAATSTQPPQKFFRSLGRFSPVWGVILVASALSILAYAWYSQRGLTLAYGDAISHIMIARRIVAGRTLGLGQLGADWLPLTHLLMLPFIWNHTLWQDGFAGSLPSMVAYVVGSAYMYRLGHLLFASRSAGLIAALAYMLNPNMLYMQSTAMTEVALNCAVILTIYYAARWARSFEADDLVKAAAAAGAGTLIRYDGWAVAGVLAALVVYIAWRHAGRKAAEANAILFGVLAFSGCIGWLIYQQVIFGSALSFLTDPYSARSQYQRDVAHLPTYHNAWLSLHIYTQAVVDTFWLPLVAIAAVGLIGWLYSTHLKVGPVSRYTAGTQPGGKRSVQLRLPANILPVYALLTPFAFNCLSMIVGITGLRTPEINIGGENTYFNERFALAMAPAVALFLAYVASWRRQFLWSVLGLIVLFCGVNSFFDTPYDLQDPLHGLTAEGRELNPIGGKWLAEHYHGGLVLISGAPFEPLIFYSDLPDQVFITDANAAEFPTALARPGDVATWIVMSSASANYDAVWETLSPRQDWRQFFVLRQVIGATYFYERVGSP